MVTRATTRLLPPLVRRTVIRGPFAIIASRKLPGTQRVYNLTVEGEHVYYVSELGLLTHNNCPAGQLSITKGAARSSLRRALNGEVGDGLRAHHLVPLDAISDPRSSNIIQAAARGGYNINGANNGVLLSSLFHSGGHKKLIERTVRSIVELGGRGFSDTQIATKLQEIANSKRTLLQKVEPGRLRALENGTRSGIHIR